MTLRKFSAKGYISKISNELAGLDTNRDKKILVTISGGVDSSTSAALIKKAGLRSDFIFIDTGLLRINEEKTAQKFFKKSLKIIDQKQLFYRVLKNVSTGQEKREVFRKTYFNILKKYVLKNKYYGIVQGTQFHKTSTKRYHNSPTEDFLKLNLKVIEPVKGLSKQQIRLVAKELNLPDEVINRRPFPGPGLLLRFGGSYTKNKLEIIREITSIVDTFLLKNRHTLKSVYQIFPYLTNESATYINTHGRGTVAPLVLIRAIVARYGKGDIVYKPFIFSKKLQEQLVNDIMNTNKISRVCFDMTSKYGSGNSTRHGGTIEYS